MSDSGSNCRHGNRMPGGRVKVAYVTFAPFISGAERSLQLILEFGPRVGIEPLVLCPPESRIIDWCQTRGVRYRTARLADRDKWHPVRWYASVISAARILRNEQIDVLHSNQVWSLASAGTAAKYLRVPRVVHVRDEMSTIATRWWCRSGVEAVICISDFVREGIAPAFAGITRAPVIRTLINPVHSQVRPGVDFRGQLGLPRDTVLLGFAGQIARVKGVIELIRALAFMTPSRPWHLVIAGRDPHPGTAYETECRRAIEQLGLNDRITVVGFLDDPGDLYASMDVAVVPSLAEPLGRVPLEAAAYGKPSIAFDTGGLREAIVDGQTGWLVPAGNIMALGCVIQDIVNLPPGTRLEAGRRARERVQAICDPMVHVQELANLYHELLSPRFEREEHLGPLAVVAPSTRSTSVEVPRRARHQ